MELQCYTLTVIASFTILLASIDAKQALTQIGSVWTKTAAAGESTNSTSVFGVSLQISIALWCLKVTYFYISILSVLDSIVDVMQNFLNAAKHSTVSI